MQIQKEWLDFLREQYPKGSRIRLTEMKDDPYALSPGSMGTLKYIDDDAQFHTRWNRSDFIGVLQENLLPEWAEEKLNELTGQNVDHSMEGMKME